MKRPIKIDHRRGDKPRQAELAKGLPSRMSVARAMRVVELLIKLCDLRGLRHSGARISTTTPPAQPSHGLTLDRLILTPRILRLYVRVMQPATWPERSRICQLVFKDRSETSS